MGLGLGLGLELGLRLGLGFGSPLGEVSHVGVVGGVVGQHRLGLHLLEDAQGELGRERRRDELGVLGE